MKIDGVFELIKCMHAGMVMATAGTTAFFNLRKRHPTLPEQPLIDYDLALLIQPSLVLGISIGVTFNVIFAEWMVTILLIALFMVTSTRSFFKGIQAWNIENTARAASLQVVPKAASEEAAEPLLERPQGDLEVGAPCHKRALEGSWSPYRRVDFYLSTPNPQGLIPSCFYGLDRSSYQQEHITLTCLRLSYYFNLMQSKTTTCSVIYWVLNLLQIPVTLGASSYEAVMLYKGYRSIGSRGDLIGNHNWKAHELVVCCGCAMLAGAAGGLLGLGGGFILAPLLLEIGIPPQVSGATATFAITFSSSMCVVEYYLLQRFPVPYAVYFFGVALVATLVGQLVIRGLVERLGRASIIILVLASTIFVSAILLGANGIVSAIYKIENDEYMGFDSLCSDS
ncbi:hypothetical protein V2J09_005462 [Rumex salicifolius]